MPIHVRDWLASPDGLGFQRVKLVRVWSVTNNHFLGEIYPSLATESSSPRRTREPDSYVYGHLKYHDRGWLTSQRVIYGTGEHK
jgi:hypothetical protein